MASIDTRIMLTDLSGMGRYLRVRTFDDRMTITDESTGQIMMIALTVSMSGDNKGDQTAATVPLETVWGIDSTNVKGATEELSGELGAIGSVGYIIREADPLLAGATVLSEMPAGILKNSLGTGILVIATAEDFPTLNQDTTGSAAKLTTARLIAGKSFDGSADITLDASDVGALPALTPISVSAPATDLATALTLINQLRSALISNNIVA